MLIDVWLHSPEPPGLSTHEHPHRSVTAGRTLLAPACRGDALRGTEVPSITVTTCSANPQPAWCNLWPEPQRIPNWNCMRSAKLWPNTQNKMPPSRCLLCLLPQPGGGLREGVGPAEQPQASASGHGKRTANGTSRDPWLGRDYALIEHRQGLCTLIALQQQVLTPLLVCIILPSVVVAIYLVLFSLVTDWLTA